MPGFAGYLSLDNKSKLKLDLPCLPSLSELGKSELQADCYHILLAYLKSFEKDQILAANEKYILGFHGNLLNAGILCTQYGVSGLPDLLLNMYQQHGIGFLRQLKGYFSGILYDTGDKTWYIFTDRYASKPIYYAQNEQVLLFSSQMKVVSEELKQMKKKLTLSEFASYCLLTYGYMLEDDTLFSEIRKLRGLLVIRDGSLRMEPLYTFDNAKFTKHSYPQILAEVNIRFQEAVKLEYEKDCLMGKRHLVTISGGLDCRVGLFMALKLGYQDMTALTFAQSGSLDHVIAEQIADEQQIEFVFHSLNNGVYLKDIQSNLISNDGLIYYAGAAHQLRAFQMFNMQDYGIVHTGQVGEILKGAYLTGKQHQHTHPGVGSFSARNLEKISAKINDIHKRHANDEMFTIRERAFNGILNGLFAISQFGEFASPFLDNDLLEFTLSIPPEYRFEGRLYKDWMKKYLPRSTRYVWDHTRIRITDPNWLSYYRRAVGLVKRKLNPNRYGLTMNPFDFWYRTNPDLKPLFNSVFDGNIDNLSDFPELSEDVSKQFKQGNFVEKAQVITLLKAIQYQME